MKVLVLNCGSSSLKYQLIDMKYEKVITKGIIERIGLDNSIVSYETDSSKIKRELTIKDHKNGLKIILDYMTDKEIGVLNSLKEIDAAGHRIVHGGEKIKDSIVLNEDSIKIIQDCIKLAPLHNPANLMGVMAIKELLPDIPNVGVFDTAFYSSMPAESYIYPLPYEYYETHRIRRFGFHGISHQYVAMRAASLLNIEFEKFNCITAHLGNGSSITAVKDGKAVDTSLGFGTMCGVPMGTRAGDIDPAVILYMIDELKMSSKDVYDTLYKKSGLFGLSGVSMDVRDIEAEANKGNKRAELALKIFAHYVSRYISALTSNLDRLDAIIFTAGIGENAISLRSMICKGLKVLGAEIDEDKNNFRSETKVFSKEDSRVKLVVIPTNEELMIALETKRLCHGILKKD